MKNIDRPLFFAFIGLTLFGLIMMSSMSVAGSFEATGRNDYYFIRHLIYIIIGIPIFLLALFFPYESLKKIAPLPFVFSIGLLLSVLVVGENYGTVAKSWIQIGGFSIQPVEIAKLSTIIFLASIFSNGKNKVMSFYGGFLPFLVILGIPSLLIIAQPDFGSLLVLALIAASIYFTAGASLKHFFGGILAAILGSSIVILTNPYIAKRFEVFMNPELDPLGAGFQVKQAIIAIGSGGAFGQGFQNSIQKFDYLPEVQSDTIFAAISEEMGFFRILLLLGIYLLIAHRGFFIAKNAEDSFAKLLAVGLTCWITGQAFINIGVNLSLLPNTGITLPLISYGGTSLLSIFMAVGLLLQLSTKIKIPNKKRYF